MSQLRYNMLLPYLKPGSVIEIEGGGGDGIPPGCYLMRANFIRVYHEVSEAQKTELVYMATVKSRSTIIEPTGDSSSKVNLQLCCPEPPSDNVNIISGQRIEFLMNELWMQGVIAKGKASGKNSFLSWLNLMILPVMSTHLKSRNHTFEGGRYGVSRGAPGFLLDACFRTTQVLTSLHVTNERMISYL